jgi:transcriptional regulator with XRE-family HTH domain
MEKSTHTTEYAVVRAELKAAREAAQLSQRALAERLRVPHSWVAKVEAGERRLDVVEMCWFLNACGKPAHLVFLDIAKLVLAIDKRRKTRKGRSS